MKILFVCSLFLFLPFTLVEPGNLSAQQLVAYDMTRINVPTSISGGRMSVNNLGIVIEGDGYIHDQNGLIGNGTPETTYSIYDLADVPANWTGMNLHNGNDDDFEIVGRIIDPNGVMRGFYVDLSVVNPQTGKSDFELLPDLGSPFSAARAINNDGDIAVQYQLPDGSWSVYVTNRVDFNTTTPLGYAVANAWPFHMNNRIYDTGTGQLIRNAQLMVELPNRDISLYTLGDPVSEVKNLDVLAGENVQGQDLNDYGDICGRIDETQIVPDRGKKTKTITVSKAMLYEYPFVNAPLQISSNSGAWGTNNEGDVVFESEYYSAYFWRGGSSFDLDDFVIGSTDDVEFWFNRDSLQPHDINERGASGFGQIVVSVAKATGNRRNRTTERRLYLLTPIVQ